MIFLSQVYTLLDCITRNQSCDYFTQIVGTAANPNQPMGRYVSVLPSDAYTTDGATAFIRNALANALAINKSTGDDSSTCLYDNVCVVAITRSFHMI